MNDRLFVRYATVCCVLIASYLLTPPDHVIQIIWQVGVGWFAAICAIVVVWQRKLPSPWPWYFFAVGIFLNSSGIPMEVISKKYLGFGPDDYPTLADAFWLSLYPALAIGMAFLVRQRASTHDWSTLVDAAIITVGLSLLSWVFLISDLTLRSDLTTYGHIVVVAYPVGDLAVLGILVRLLLQGGRKTSVLLISASITVFLMGDLTWAFVNRIGYPFDGMPRMFLEMVFLSAFALLGAAAIHPSAREASYPLPPRPPGISPSFLVVLAITSLIPPALLLYQAFSGVISNAYAIGFSTVVLFLLVLLRVVGLLRNIEIQALKLNALSRMDELTGLPNRRTIFQELPLALERARRDNTPIVVAMIDLDKFKLFNDTYGHPAGDKLLKGAATAWSEKLRTVDLLARYGGEEFIALLPSTNEEDAVKVLDRLRPGTPADQTFSAGIASWNRLETPEELVMRADQALYRAKERGRNCSVRASEVIPAT